MKNCGKCKLTLLKVQFSKNKSKKDGLQDYCKSCDKSYYVDNQQDKIGYQKDYRKSHKDEIKTYQKDYYIANKDSHASYNKTYEKERRCLDIQFKLAKNLRTRLGSAIKRGQKAGSAVTNLGCTIEELKIHLESQFYPNSITGEVMTWENYGLHGWHIDHIKPLTSFDLTNLEDVKIACSYKNLQPLWAKDNLSKSDK